MLQWRKDVMPVQVATHMVADDVFKHLACYAGQADRAVIFCLAGHWGEPHDGCSCNHRQHGPGQR